MKIMIICAICTAVIALSCGKGSGNKTISDLIVKPGDVSAIEPSKPSADNNAVVAADTAGRPVPEQNDILQNGSSSNQDWDKKIIKTANITLELVDYKSYNTSIHQKVKTYGAYIAQEQQSEANGEISSSLSIKVPVDKFDDLVNALPGQGIKLIKKNISAEDVTAETVDVKARMEAKKKVRDRYIELLRQAKNMEEVLQVQTEINSIQEEIESATGRLDYLTHASAYSTINLRYYQYMEGTEGQDTEPGFFTKLSTAFKAGTSVISGLVLSIISIWPLMILGAAAFAYFKRYRVKEA